MTAPGTAYGPDPYVPPPGGDGGPSDPGGRGPSVAPGKRRRLGCLLTLLGLVLTLCVLGGVASRLWKSVPEYWVRHQRFVAEQDRPALREQADGFEQRVLAQTANAPPPTAEMAPAADEGEMQTLSASLAEINAWLATNAQRWAANQSFPPQMKDFMLEIEGEDLVLAFRYDSPEVNQVISCVFRIEPWTPPVGGADAAAEPEGVVLRLVRVRAGRLPIPPWALPRHIQKNSDSTNTAWMDHLNTLAEGMPLGPVPVPGGQLRVLRVHVRPDGVDATVRHEPREERKRRK